MRAFLPLLLLSLIPLQAQAYIGPGAGLGAIGILVAMVVVVVLLVAGFVWYPIKRMLSRRKNKKEQNTDKR